MTITRGKPVSFDRAERGDRKIDIKKYISFFLDRNPSKFANPINT